MQNNAKVFLDCADKVYALGVLRDVLSRGGEGYLASLFKKNIRKDFMLVTYSSNNSGGDWWLEDKDWFALEKAGWKVDWHKDDPDGFMVRSDGRRLGALANRASKEFDSPGQAMREFKEITGQAVSDEGCECCGAPHNFSWSGGWASGEDCLRYVLFSDDYTEDET